jgi:hypothetical protein
MAWSEAEVDTLISHYLAVGPEWNAIQKALPGRNKTGIYQKVWKLKKNGAIPDDTVPPPSPSPALLSSSATDRACPSALPLTSSLQPRAATATTGLSLRASQLSGPTVVANALLAAATTASSPLRPFSTSQPHAVHSDSGTMLPKNSSSSKRRRSSSSSSSSSSTSGRKPVRRSTGRKTPGGSSATASLGNAGKPKQRARRWSEEDLQELYRQFRVHQTNWEEIGKSFPNRNVTSIATKFSKLKSAGKLPPDVHASYVSLTYHRHHWWDKQEVETLVDLLHTHGPGEWERYFVPALPRRSKNDIITKYRSLAKQGKIPENPKWTPEEERVLVSLAQLHSDSGSEWSPAPASSSDRLSRTALVKSKRAAAKRAIAAAASASVSTTSASTAGCAPSPQLHSTVETEQQTPNVLSAMSCNASSGGRRRRKAIKHLPHRSLQANSPLLASMAPLRVCSLASSASASYSEALSPVQPHTSDVPQPQDQVPRDSPATFSAVSRPRLTTLLRGSPSPPHLPCAGGQPMDERSDDSVFSARSWSHANDLQVSRWLLHYGKACYGPQNGVVSWYRELAERLQRTSLEVHLRIGHLERVGAFRFDEHRKLVACTLRTLSGHTPASKHAPLSSDEDDEEVHEERKNRPPGRDHEEALALGEVRARKRARNPVATLTNARAMFAAAAAAATEADASWQSTATL